VTILGDNLDNIKKKRESLIDASEKVSLEVDAEKTKYMFLTPHQNAGQNRDINVTNRPFSKCGTVKKFWNDYNKSKFDSGGNYEETEIRQCLLSFSPEPYFACGSVWL
jgi:hypothetical protein